MTQEINVSPGKVNLLLMELKQKCQWELFDKEYRPNGNYQSVTVCWPSRSKPMVVANIGLNNANEYAVRIKYVDVRNDNQFTFTEWELEIFLKILQELKETNHDS